MSLKTNLAAVVLSGDRDVAFDAVRKGSERSADAARVLPPRREFLTLLC